MDLITDRTESDIHLGNEKGVYSYSDLNRVEAAVREIAAMIPSLGLDLSLETKTDWGLPGMFSKTEWPVASQMDRYLGNVAAIRNAFSVPVQLPSSMRRLTWSGANRIERVLQIAMTRAQNTIESFKYSGEIFAGEEL